MNVVRARLVGHTVGGLLVGEMRRNLGFRSMSSLTREEQDRPDLHQQRARAVRQALEHLGPLYVKIGQMLSTRPDLVPDYMIDEFENLHAKVTSTPFSDFEPVLDEELGRDWKRYFRDFDTAPIGTASLAQVYAATLRSGRPAVVKIQRPGIRQMMLDDMALLQTVVRRIARRAPDFNDVIDLEAMLGLVFDAMRPELDFTIEAQNMDAFRERVNEFDALSIPEVLFVTPRVLVQSLAAGASIREVDKNAFTAEQRDDIGTQLLAFMFWGYFVDRRFHADPHPGNIFISPDGVASIIDWGMVSKIDRNLSTALVIVLLSMGLNDGTGVARTWIEMGRATRRADIAGFVSDMGRFIPSVVGASLEQFNFGVQLTTILKYSAKRGIATPPAVSMLGKSFANIEGSVRYLAPELSLIGVFQEEFKTISQELARELLGHEHMARSASQAYLMAAHGPAQIRSVLTDMANRDLTVLMGEEMSKRSRREDRADARQRRIERTALVGLAAAYLWDRRARRP